MSQVTIMRTVTRAIAVTAAVGTIIGMFTVRA